MELYRPDLLDPDKHKRDSMDCGDAGLDEWLRRYAGQSRRGNTAATWVIADRDYRVVCYATLSMTSIPRVTAPARVAKGAPAAISALLIGRLATDRSMSGLGIATSMVGHLLATAAELNLKAACRAVVVNAANPRAHGWWQRFGFVPFDADDAANLDLYLLTDDIQATLADWA